MKPTLTWWGAFQTKRFQQNASTRRALLIISYNRQVKRIFSAVMSRPESMFDWLARPYLLKSDPCRCSVGSTALRKKCLYSELFWSGLNTERYSVGGKIWTMITPNTDTFHAAQYCLCGELGRLPRLVRRKVILRPFIVGFYWKFRRVVFCFSWLCQVQLTLFCTVATWRLLLWFSLTRRRRPLIHKYFHSITIAYLNSGITIIVLFSQEKSLRWMK